MKKQLRLLTMPAFGNAALPLTGMPTSNPLISRFANSGGKSPSLRYSQALDAGDALRASGTAILTMTFSAVAFAKPY